MDFLEKFGGKSKSLVLIGVFASGAFTVLTFLGVEKTLAIIGTFIILVFIALWVFFDDLNEIKDKLSKLEGKK